jgi:hypothetical protein
MVTMMCIHFTEILDTLFQPTLSKKSHISKPDAWGYVICLVIYCKTNHARTCATFQGLGLELFDVDHSRCLDFGQES